MTPEERAELRRLREVAQRLCDTYADKVAAKNSRPYSRNGLTSWRTKSPVYGRTSMTDRTDPEPMVTIRRSLYESLARLAEKALEATGEHRKVDGGYCPDCQGQCLRDWLTRPPLPPKPSADRQWDGS